MEKSELKQTQTKSGTTDGPEKNTSTPVNEIKAVYIGKVASFFSHSGIDYALHPGESYSLPAECSHVRSLIGQNLLTTSKK